MANHLRNFNYAFREVDKFVKNSKEAVEARRNTKQIMSNLNRFFSDNGNKGNFCRATISGELQIYDTLSISLCDFFCAPRHLAPVGRNDAYQPVVMPFWLERQCLCLSSPFNFPPQDRLKLITARSTCVKRRPPLT